MFLCLVANRFSQSALLKLKQTEGMEAHSAEDITELKQFWGTAEGLLIRSGTKVNKKLLNEMPKLRVVISATSGFDHIDLKECNSRGITVMHTPHANVQSAAEHTWGLILASQRKYLRCTDQIRKGNWQRGSLVGQELHGKSLGIIGFGRIGQRVFKMAEAFDMKVQVHDPYVDQTPFPQVKFLGYEEVVRNSDIITFHVPLTTETKNMVNHNSLEWFNDSATLVNASRGAVISLDALLSFLPENPQFSVALDVFPSEPLSKESQLLQNPNVFCTPHVGATTEQGIAKASVEAVDKMIAFSLHEKISDSLPPNAIWAEKLIEAP
jgi:D-3-phosphoglycerate dehydrogenase / 2-oxoglutarate reductase